MRAGIRAKEENQDVEKVRLNPAKAMKNANNARTAKKKMI